mmetsp:Transcript_273/g.630  ORF Transcript_273/g.630 Transcript_273/m.630 type:complete len:221 (+) Transcript_273:125-787(+)
MMNIYINIQNPLMLLQKLQNSKNNIINVAKPRCLPLFGMMHASTPVHHHIRRAIINQPSSSNRTTSIYLEILKHPIKHRAISLSHRPQVEPPHLQHKLLLVLRRDTHQKIYIIVRMKLHDILPRPRLWTHQPHLRRQPIPIHQIGRQLYSMRPHRIPTSIIIIRHLLIIKIHNRLVFRPHRALLLLFDTTARKPFQILLTSLFLLYMVYIYQIRIVYPLD